MFTLDLNLNKSINKMNNQRDYGGIIKPSNYFSSDLAFVSEDIIQYNSIRKKINYNYRSSYKSIKPLRIHQMSLRNNPVRINPSQIKIKNNEDYFSDLINFTNQVLETKNNSNSYIKKLREKFCNKEENNEKNKSSKVQTTIKHHRHSKSQTYSLLNKLKSENKFYMI